MIVEPPRDPITMYSSLFLSMIMGVIELNGFLPGAIAFASDPVRPNKFGAPGLELKSSISEFRKYPPPGTQTLLPKLSFNVVVIAAALPRPNGADEKGIPERTFWRVCHRHKTFARLERSRGVRDFL